MLWVIFWTETREGSQWNHCVSLDTTFVVCFLHYFDALEWSGCKNKKQKMKTIWGIGCKVDVHNSQLVISRYSWEKRQRILGRLTNSKKFTTQRQTCEVLDLFTNHQNQPGQKSNKAHNTNTDSNSSSPFHKQQQPQWSMQADPCLTPFHRPHSQTVSRRRLLFSHAVPEVNGRTYCFTSATRAHQSSHFEFAAHTVTKGTI